MLNYFWDFREEECMRIPKPIPEKAVARLGTALQKAKTKAEYQRVQCLWLRAALGLSSAQVAQAIGWRPD